MNRLMGLRISSVTHNGNQVSDENTYTVIFSQSLDPPPFPDPNSLWNPKLNIFWFALNTNSYSILLIRYLNRSGNVAVRRNSVGVG